MTNSLITNYLCDYFENRTLFHYLITDTTNERISWFIEKQNISDRTFIQPLNTKVCIDKFKMYPSDYYDYVIIDHCYYGLEDIINYFKPKEFLSIYNYNHKEIKNLYDYIDIKKEHSSNYVFGYNFERLDFKIKELLNGNQYIVLFPFSTRGLASINLEGILKINELAKSKQCKLLLAGIDANVYLFNGGLSENLKRFKNSDLLDDNIINVMGLSINKILHLIKNAMYVFYGPTGTSVLPVLGLSKNVNNYIISGGNSDIVIDILKTFPDAVNSVKNIRPICPFFPCDVQKFNTNLQNLDKLPHKVKSCVEANQAKCLNEELDIKL
jgi:hypothetical protein